MTDRPTDHATLYVAIGRIYVRTVMWPNNTNFHPLVYSFYVCFYMRLARNLFMHISLFTGDCKCSYRTSYVLLLALVFHCHFVPFYERIKWLILIDWLIDWLIDISKPSTELHPYEGCWSDGCAWAYRGVRDPKSGDPQSRNNLLSMCRCTIRTVTQILIDSWLTW